MLNADAGLVSGAPHLRYSGGMARKGTIQGKLLYEVYEYRLLRSLNRDRLPRHIGVILDGNRRWARAFGSSPAEGHKAGGHKVLEFLGWADEVETEVVTLWMLSTDNLGRDPEELTELLAIISETVDQIVATGRYRVKIVGATSLLPEESARRLLEAAERTHGFEGAMQVNVAVGYGGRHELVDAVRSLLNEAEEEGLSAGDVADKLSVEDITEHLYTRGQPDPDLIIRTSGEQRLSGFLLWQSAHSEYYFCETFWPDFRKVDFLRALRTFTQRERRLGR